MAVVMNELLVFVRRSVLYDDVGALQVDDISERVPVGADVSGGLCRNCSSSAAWPKSTDERTLQLCPTCFPQLRIIIASERLRKTGLELTSRLDSTNTQL